MTPRCYHAPGLFDTKPRMRVAAACWLRGHVAGGLPSISLQDAVVQGPSLLVGSMSGPGMSATNLTLVQDPVSPVAPSDWGIPSPGAPQSGTGAAAVPVAAIVVPVVLATALAAVSGAWVAAAWRRRRRRAAAAYSVPPAQQASPDGAVGADMLHQQDQDAALVVDPVPAAAAAGRKPLLKLGGGSGDGSSGAGGDAPGGRVSNPSRLTAVRTVEGLQALKAAIAATSMEMLGRRLAPGRLGSTPSSAVPPAAGAGGDKELPPAAAAAAAAAAGPGADQGHAGRGQPVGQLAQAAGGGSPRASGPLGGVQLHELLGQVRRDDGRHAHGRCCLLRQPSAVPHVWWG